MAAPEPAAGAGSRHPTAREVERAISAVHRYWHLGRDSWCIDGERLPYGQGKARWSGHSAEMYRKARDVSSQYDLDALHRLFGLCRQRRFRVGITHLIRLATVPKKDRPQIERDMVEGAWSLRQLNAVIRLRYGNRKEHAGKKPKIPLDPQFIRMELWRLTAQWFRFALALEGISNANDCRSEQALRPSERELLRGIQRQMANLQARLSKGQPRLQNKR